MKIKRYEDFILENSSDIKYDLIKYFDQQKDEIISKGLDFEELKRNLIKSLDSLDPRFIEQSTIELSQVDIEDKEEFSRVFENILHKICEKLEQANINEGFISMVKSIWQEVKIYISKAVKWISDRIWSIQGYLTMSLAGILFIINTWGSGLGMPEVFGNVVVNTVLLIGIALLKYGRKNDEYKKISEI